MSSRAFSATDAARDPAPNVNVQPQLGRSARSLVRRFARKLLDTQSNQELAAHKEQFLKKAASDRDAQALRVSLAILFDLKLQGWALELTRSAIHAKPPEPLKDSPAAEKSRLRDGHLHQRNNQLCQPATREFVRKMERQRRGPNGWVSIFSLMRDGQELAEKLRSAAKTQDPSSQIQQLKESISPYLQIVESGRHCAQTGLLLTDIWRYFRHTWTTPYNSTPGRKIWILVRDRAAPNHPVIGIAAIGNAVVQLSVRDRWIGWTSDEFLKRLSLNADYNWERWLDQSLAALINGIDKTDFLSERLLTTADLRSPNETTIARLLRDSAKTRQRHQKYPKRDEHKGRGRSVKFSWHKRARLDLFRAKRAESLSELLTARMRLRESLREGDEFLKKTLDSSQGRRAIETVLKHVKASHVGIDLLDITVCGAIAPYNSILGGKLVSLLLTSPEIVRAYTRRYATTPSIIASSMAGRPVRRAPKLVLLGTTGLYNVNPSQYNRLRIEAADVGGCSGQSIRFERLGESEGFGSYHFSQETAREVEVLLAQSHPGTRVNSIFGEGVNPKLRKLRAGVDLLGLDSNALLNHRSSRVVYAIPLASNFRDVLLGLTARPRYILPQAHPRMVTERIAEFWMRRWLAHRISNDAVLDTTSTHSVFHPISHGARVLLPTIDNDNAYLALDHDRVPHQPNDILLPASAANMITVSCRT
jgi:Druantia protein DruA